MRGVRVTLAVVALLTGLLCTGCADPREAADEKEIAQITQMYLMDQANSVTQNREFNRFLGTNRLPADRIVPPLSDVLKTEAGTIKIIRDRLLESRAEHDWAKVEMSDPQIKVSGDTAIMHVTEGTEMHYRTLGGTTSYIVDHRLTYVRISNVWKIATDDLDLPRGGTSPTPYERTPN